LCPPPPTGIQLQKRLIFTSFPSLFLIKCISIVQGGFALVLQVCIYHALIRLMPPRYLLILYLHAPLIFYILLYSTLYYIHK
jgi:hypothetical protein